MTFVQQDACHDCPHLLNSDLAIASIQSTQLLLQIPNKLAVAGCQPVADAAECSRVHTMSASKAHLRHWQIWVCLN